MKCKKKKKSLILTAAVWRLYYMRLTDIVPATLTGHLGDCIVRNWMHQLSQEESTWDMVMDALGW